MATSQLSYQPIVIVDTTGLTEEEWLDYRRTGIGGSDASAVLGVSPFVTTRDLYYDKLKIVAAIDDEDNWVARKSAICSKTWWQRYSMSKRGIASIRSKRCSVTRLMSS